MNWLRNLMCDAGFHLLIFVLLIIGAGIWMLQEEPERQNPASNKVACSFCGEMISANLIKGHILIGHYDSLTPKTGVRVTTASRDNSDRSRVGTMETVE
jgi:hypothetical protein